MNLVNDPESLERAERQFRTIGEYLTHETPQERDRRLQVFLAQARGPLKNLRLLLESTAFLLRARRAMQSPDTRHVGQ